MASAACLSAWRRDWDEEQRAADVRRHELLAKDAAEQAASKAASDVHGEMLAKLEAALAEAARERDELRARLEGHALSKEEEAARQAQLKREEEHEKRVAHLQQVAVRRISQLALGRGWGAWLDAYVEGERRKRLLASAVGRLQRPKVAVCVAHWRIDF